MIRCYCDPPSVQPGEEILLHVSVTSGRYKLRLYQQRESLNLVSDFEDEVFEGESVPDGNCDEDSGWPVHRLATQDGWQNGAYVVMAAEVDATGTERWPELADTAGEAGKALVVLRSERPSSPVLYKISWFTLACYNWTGGGSCIPTRCGPTAPRAAASEFRGVGRAWEPAAWWRRATRRMFTSAARGGRPSRTGMHPSWNGYTAPGISSTSPLTWT